MEDAATMGSNPFMMAGRMTDALASAMETAAGNPNGAMTGFMGMGMAMNNMGGFNPAQMYQAGVQQQAQQQAQQPAPAAPAADSWQCSCGNTVSGNFCPNCGGKKPAPQPAEKNHSDNKNEGKRNTKRTRGNKALLSSSPIEKDAQEAQDSYEEEMKPVDQSNDWLRAVEEALSAAKEKE
jgi:hypothetical protein